jgi:hypothetical protein
MKDRPYETGCNKGEKTAKRYFKRLSLQSMRKGDPKPSCNKRSWNGQDKGKD